MVCCQPPPEAPRGTITRTQIGSGGTQFVVAGSRDRPDELDLAKRFEHALVAFDFARQQGPEDIDAEFARKVVAGRRGPDGREQAFLRSDSAIAD